MKNSPNHTRLGSYISRSAVAGETYHAYVPTALPPVPALDMDSLYKSLDQAMRALGEVDALAKLLPDISMFLYMYVRKEALISSQIEGTQSSLSDLLLFENDEKPSVPVDDVEEVSNYIAALNHGLARCQEDFPLKCMAFYCAEDEGRMHHRENFVGHKIGLVERARAKHVLYPLLQKWLKN
jgi:hypothetical protein